jgi:2-oxoglutarate/2-oxoacid ferredoxin oxidoreductase subunit alpha
MKLDKFTGLRYIYRILLFQSYELTLYTNQRGCMKTFKDDLSIVLSGGAGQGIQSIESILTSLLKNAGYNLFATKEYMSRVRGGVNSTEIRVSSNRVNCFVDKIDILIPLLPESIDHLKQRINEKTIVIGEKELIKYAEIIDINFSRLAKEIGSEIYANTIASGLIAGLLKISDELCLNYIKTFFAGKTENIINKNTEAMKKGLSIGNELSGEIKIELTAGNYIQNDILLPGNDAIALGALAGGCDYICGYPMSPSTSVLEKMSSYSKKFGIIAEQVEDEIGVINMALGAWYAGARAMVTTSGGGFALMTEGLSLCGMIESPLVVLLSQRPGPATGLPTRTEQGDLNLTLYAGHGEFPRIILSPGDLSQGFELTRKAFDLADRYQVPVIILTDQYYVDSYYNTPSFEISKLDDKNIVRTSAGYKRFKINSDGISPRGIPGFGEGNVCVDSDEHDESGYITEDPELRVEMTGKRLAKFESIKKDIIKPDLYGNENTKNLIICWGSTLNIVLEAVKNINKKNLSVLHFSWVFPLPDNLGEQLKKSKNLIIIENNETSQLGQLIKVKTGIDITNRILKFDGLPFSVEEIYDGVKYYL